jgi:peptide/nickel transport system ATP-binding protein
MRQRVMIAMALVCRPDVLVADEPTTALDVTVQAQIFDLIADLRDRTGTAVMLITHDMGAVAEMADRVVVMYAGHIVESGAVAEVLREPLHPYTRGLIACAPGSRTAAPGTLLEEIPGSVPSLIERGPGCLFADRCGQVQPRCRAERPPNVPGSPGRTVMCWLHAGGGAPP